MISIIQPKSELLQKYIDCFYVFNKPASNDYRYVAFPHYNTGLSFIKNAEITRGDFEVNINSAESDNICIEVLGKYLSPIFVKYSGEISEYSIIFKPLGICHFINKSYHDIAQNYSQVFINSEWTDMAHELFRSKDIHALENFLINRFKIPEKIDIVYEAINYIENSNDDLNILDLSKKLNLNIKTLQRLFIKHLACSPSEYKRIYRFRNSINSKLNSNDIKSLTEISYENNYYDQSYFIKEFKKLSKHNPKNFFKEISKIDGGKILWEII